MSTAMEAVLAPARASVRLPPEYRFPLHLEPSVGSVWQLYNDAKQDGWIAATRFDWSSFDADRFATNALGAARLVWSQRAWTLAGRLSETPALLVRFCLERQRESDPKYFLSARGSADAAHLDAVERVAALLGGLWAEPDDADYGARYDIGLHSQILSADESLDSAVAAYAVYRDGLDAALLMQAQATTHDALLAGVLERLRTDRERQVEFGWVYLLQRAPAWNAGERAAIARRIASCRAQFVDSGVLLPAFGQGAGAAALANAGDAAAGAGLGGVSRADAALVRERFEHGIRERFAGLDVEL